MPDTASFIQLRSTPIRLRRELQKVGFLTPIEIEHAILVAGSDRKMVDGLLQKDGYAKGEIGRAVAAALAQGHLSEPKSGHLAITVVRRPQTRRYFLLDLVAIKGKTLTKGESTATDFVLVPGYGPFRGLAAAELRTNAVALAPSLAGDWTTESDYIKDLEWLAKHGFVICNCSSLTLSHGKT